MLKLEVLSDGEYFIDERFIKVDPVVLELEHSLYAISKWESKWKKPYISIEDKTFEENLDYVRCMTLNDVPDYVYSYLTKEEHLKIIEYLNDNMTAKVFYNEKKGGIKRTITSDDIYWIMIQNGIPFECDRWNFNRLMTLIKICALKTEGGGKMKRSEIYEQNRMLNAMRKAKKGR